MKIRNNNLLLAALGLLWLAAVGVGLQIMWKYEHAPGPVAAPAAGWPAESRIRRASDRATLVMFTHPHCPCTRASIGELALLMANGQNRVAAEVVFYQPEGFSGEWAQTELWQSAAAIPGVTVGRDPGGVEARRFQAATSGQVLLYDAAGRLLFSGGITGSRGHAGDNAGRSAIVSFLRNCVGQVPNLSPESDCRGTGWEPVPHIFQTPVFGCSLRSAHRKDEVESCNQ